MTTPHAAWTPSEVDSRADSDAAAETRLVTTDARATDTAATDAPATDTPATDIPATDAPATDAPATDALSAAGRALEAVDNLPLERHPEAFAHFDELLRAALEAPPQVASG